MMINRAIICLIPVLLSGCMLLKNRSKNTLKSKSEISEQSYLERVNLKTADKETNVYTHWNDSSGYQFQNILERIDEKKQMTTNTEERQVMQEQKGHVISEPKSLWRYGMFAMLLIGIWVVRFLKR